MTRQKPRRTANGASGVRRAAAPTAAGPSRPASSTPSMSSLSDELLVAAAEDPDLAVSLSTLVPELLRVTADRSNAFLKRPSRPPASTSKPRGSSRATASTDRTSSSLEGGITTSSERDSMADWGRVAHWSTMAIAGLCNTSRLPQQQVLERFAKPTAGGWHRMAGSCVWPPR